MRNAQRLGLLIVAFLAAYWIPFGSPRVSSAVLEGFYMLQDYTRQHVLFCLVPALFIAGAISNFVSQATVLKYFSGQAKQWLAYAVASVSGAILAVCSCTVLPLFSGIYKRGAGLGPATAFLYSGPAINVLAIILTARILGWQLGLARALGAILFSVVIGLIMAFLYRNEERQRATATANQFRAASLAQTRAGWQTGLYFATLVGILIFAAWGKPAEPLGFWQFIYQAKWYLTGVLLVALGLMLLRWFHRDELRSWLAATEESALQILPLLFIGVLIAGVLMGRPGTNAGLIPSRWIAAAVGGNSLRANLLSSVAGALMYFATLTEIPILQGLLGAGMGQGPALALLLAGPALSLPSMLVLRRILGTKKALAYIGLVIVMATLTGWVFGALS